MAKRSKRRLRLTGLGGGALLFLAGTASGQLIVSLDRLENLSIRQASFSCRVAYGAVLIGCDGSNFSNRDCSSRCQQSVADVQANVQRTCGNAEPGATRLLSSALRGTLVTDLCGTRAGQNNGELTTTATSVPQVTVTPTQTEQTTTVPPSTQQPTTVTEQPTTVVINPPTTTTTSSTFTTSTTPTFTTTTSTSSTLIVLPQPTTFTTNTRSTIITSIDTSTTFNPVIFPTTTTQDPRSTIGTSLRSTIVSSSSVSFSSSTTLETSTITFLPGPIVSIPNNPTTTPTQQPPQESTTSTSSSVAQRPTRIPGSGGGSPADFVPAVADSGKLDCRRALASVVVAWTLLVLAR